MPIRTRRAVLPCFAATLLAMTVPTEAQWENRYNKLSEFGHHVYLEQHELPILAAGPTDPAPAPDGETLVFSAQGWLWLLNLETGVADRLTDGAGVDARPRWSPDGERLAFVRDTGLDTQIVVMELENGDETVIDSDWIDLDPEFSADGATLYFASADGGKLDLWRQDLTSGARERLTDLPQVERNVRRLPGDSGMLYLHGNGAHRHLRVRDFLTGQDEIVHRETLTYHLSADVHPTERLAVFSAPIDTAYHLWTLDLDNPSVRHRLTDGDSFALTPAYSADGEDIYYVVLDERRQFQLMRIDSYGGEPTPVPIREWRYGAGTGRLTVTMRDAQGAPVTARVSITAENGHPVAYPGDATFFDSQNGRHYFYVNRETTLELPAGRYDIHAARGPMTPAVSETIRVRRGDEAQLALSFSPVWDSADAGYVSADYHVHLNGDGHHRATHENALRAMAGEDLDHLAPMSWNRWERRIDRPLVGLQTERDGRIVDQGQEVRSHFHGHIGLARIDDPFEPWFWGPSNPVLGNPDRSNAEVTAYADEVGAFPTYVHPVGGDEDPFANGSEGQIPLELVADGVLSARMGIELVCAWTSPLGTAEVWYRLLNIGRPVAAISGTDAWVDFHRTPTVGTARAYVRPVGEDRGFDAVLNAAAAGRSFLTTGPALVFRLGDGSAPGDVTRSGAIRWTVTLASTADVDVLELVVNGEVVEVREGISAGETRTLDGTLELPEGGWVAARAYATEPGQTGWPSMHARPFAHSSPIWIGSVGSTHPAASAQAAADLLRAVDVAQEKADRAYGEQATPRLDARFEAARLQLQSMLPQEPSTEAP